MYISQSKVISPEQDSIYLELKNKLELIVSTKLDPQKLSRDLLLLAEAFSYREIDDKESLQYIMNFFIK